MKALVTGGAGFIGSHLVESLARTHDVTVIDKVAPTRPVEGVHYIKSRVQDVYDAPRADIVYHLAGPVGPVAVTHLTGRMTPDIIDMARWLWDYVRAGVRVVFVSTSEIYGEQAQPMDEQAPRIIAAGHSARMEYATAKLAAETMLLNMGGDVRVIRPFNVAGPGQKSYGGFVLPRFLEQARDGQALTVYTPGTQRRAFTHVLDIVDGIRRAGLYGHRNTAYNLGNPDNECSIMELADDVIALTNSRVGIDIIDPMVLWGEKFREAPDKVPDIAKAKTDLLWTPTRSREQTILDAWRQY